MTGTPSTASSNGATEPTWAGVQPARISLTIAPVPLSVVSCVPGMSNANGTHRRHVSGTPRYVRSVADRKVSRVVYIPTERTQAKLREIFHEQCNAACPGPEPVGWTVCNRLAVIALGKLLPVISSEMFPAVRHDMRSKISETIIGELVCCEVFEQAEKISQERQLNPLMLPKDVVRNFTDMPWHDMCFYGGWAASLALNECPSGRRKCEPSYWCPSSGEWESPCHGGFDVCCAHPERHQAVQPRETVTPD